MLKLLKPIFMGGKVMKDYVYMGGSIFKPTHLHHAATTLLPLVHHLH